MSASNLKPRTQGKPPGGRALLPPFTRPPVTERCADTNPQPTRKGTTKAAGSTPAVDTKTTPPKHMPQTRRKTTTQRGLGHRHQQQRRKLLRNLKPGTPCWWCGKPMHPDQQLDADHQQSRHHGGHQANRLLHSACNSQRQAGQNDARRPAAGHPDAFKPPQIRLKNGKPDPRNVQQTAKTTPAFRW